MNKSRTAAVVALVIALSLFSPQFASADNRGSRTPSPSDVNTDFKSAVEKFKQDQKTFIEALRPMTRQDAQSIKHLKKALIKLYPMRNH